MPTHGSAGLITKQGTPFDSNQPIEIFKSKENTQTFEGGATTLTEPDENARMSSS